MQRKSREEKMSEIQKKLEDGTRAIFESETYAKYIETFSRFPRYSVNNCILIASQKPDATYVCGMKTWNDLNRRINKNENGIMILAPIKRKADVKEQMYDTENHPVIGEDGKLVTETVTREFQSFRPVYVWDYEQTSGEPLPSLVHNLMDNVNGYDTLKNILIEVSPVPITFEPINGGANGYYSPLEQKIVVKDDLSELQTVKTMIHEIGHTSLGHGGKDDKWDRATHEVQAESISYWVSQMLNLDTSEYSFGYISGWSKDKDVSELKEHLDLIKSTADKISKAIEEKYAEIEKQEKQIEETHEEERAENMAVHKHR